MADASLFGRGVRASARIERIGAHESAEFKEGDIRLNFVRMGDADPQACALPLHDPPGNPRPAAHTPLPTTAAGRHACGPARAPACRVPVQPCARAAAPNAGRAPRGCAAEPVHYRRRASVRPPARVGAPPPCLPEREPACPQAGPECRAVSAASAATARVVGRARRRRGAARDAPARVPVALPRRAHRRAQRADGRHLHQGQPVGSQRRTRDVARGRLNAAGPPFSPPPPHPRPLSRQSPDHLTPVPTNQARDAARGPSGPRQALHVSAPRRVRAHGAAAVCAGEWRRATAPAGAAQPHRGAAERGSSPRRVAPDVATPAVAPVAPGGVPLGQAAAAGRDAAHCSP